MTITFGSLFAGIGGLDLGLERSGMQCVWQVENDQHATRVLEKHWPDVRRWDDVRTFPPDPAEEWGCDLICGGFPCQDISFAGKGAGLSGDRSGLWYEFARIVGVVRPRFVLVENVAALLVRGLDVVLGTLASLGYDAEWHCIPAAYVGAPHIRDRVFVLAYARHTEPQRWNQGAEVAGPWIVRGNQSRSQPAPCSSVGTMAGADVPDALRPICESGTGGRRIREGDTKLADANCPGLPIGRNTSPGRTRRETTTGATKRGPVQTDDRSLQGHTGWDTEPDVGRVAHGIPARVDRLRCLGNAVVPQVAEWIGKRIIQAEAKGGAS